MSPDMPSLDQLGVKFETDKSSRKHGYLAFYERFFEKFRLQPITVLEIGILRGASLRVWHEYFPHATIVGADINPAVPEFPDPRVKIEILDQSNLEDLVRLGVKHGPFDIIIEDGSHQWEHQITTLRTLFPFLRDGGLYIVEDLETNYGAAEAAYRGVASFSCVEYLKRLVDLRVADTHLDLRQQEDAFLRTYGRSTQFIAFFRHGCLIEKAHPGSAVSLSVDPSWPTEPAATKVPLSILAHLGEVGDQRYEGGIIRQLASGRNIQGFRLAREGGPPVLFEYRVRRASGAWTDWVAAGSFAGTRGQSDDLTGYSVRVLPEWQDRFAVELVGLFRDTPGPVRVRGGENCVPPPGHGPLCGMRVTLYQLEGSEQETASRGVAARSQAPGPRAR